ncbi:MAG: T9SS type A sorting domain-containing protein [Bacteroidetes bacterium]|nr:T9SS type A sorting domain-containing protein [Bacteroidota bacterium]
MKNALFLIVLAFFITNICCQKSIAQVSNMTNSYFSEDTIQGSIKAGQQTGCGIIYTDVNPVIHVGGEIDPIFGGGGYVKIDIDYDSIDDFKITYFMESHLVQSAGLEDINIKAINPNASVSISMGSYLYNDSLYTVALADSLLYDEMIDSTQTWSDGGIIHRYYWDMVPNSYNIGYWPSYNHYIGVRMLKENRPHYGWIKIEAVRELTGYAFSDSCSTSATTNYVEPGGLSIYPNPFSFSASISIPDKYNNSTLVIYNSNGQQVKQVKNINGTNCSLFRDNLSSGIYFYTLERNNEILTSGKFLITGY